VKHNFNSNGRAQRPETGARLQPMAPASDSSACSGLAARDAEPAKLDEKISKAEEKLTKVETEIDTLNKRLDADEFKPDRRYSSLDDVKAALKDLKAEKVALQNEKVALQNEKVALQNEKVELLREKNIRLEQQQQSGAGTSMLMCFERPALSLPKIVCCLHSLDAVQRVSASCWRCLPSIDAIDCMYWLFVSLSQKLQCPKGTWRRYRPLLLKSLTK
jgi:hypothetical protein